ncbi:hypothetical protein [Oceanirhabdus sp. W0125-5]|uniref:hypothetical protein n=1 Tax=Oceanirhabdus sp. W0125-5 TaxID=2999116 RepID=UPI0022F32B7B|nr:hypothetical protein [Oceanirhabdus sp. W0125-5]WBW96135.1 hypothetical protein OW730_20945 [Oceanirhabdus sp. W0125-5]
MDKLKDINELKQLFEDLFLIVDKYGDNTINNQKKIIKRLIDKIDSIDISNFEERFIEIQRDYKNLYPVRGGLSEFYIWNDDFNERQKLNKPLSKIRERLWEILK